MVRDHKRRARPPESASTMESSDPTPSPHVPRTGASSEQVVTSMRAHRRRASSAGGKGRRKGQPILMEGKG